MGNLDTLNRQLGLPALAAAVVLATLQGAVLDGAAPPPKAVIHTEVGVPGGWSVAPGFVPNRGQMTGAVRYSARLSGYTALFTDRGAVFAFPRHALKLQFVGTDGPRGIEARDQLPGKVNYLIGHDQTKWQVGLPTYGEIMYREVWREVDLAFRHVDGEIKYELTVMPGARVETVRFEYEGARRLSVTPGGDLLIDTPQGSLIDHRPRSHQMIDGKEIAVETRFVVDGSKHRYGFRLGAYDRSRPLVIDPGLAYAAYIGGSGDDLPRAVAVDAAGSVYVAGQTTSLDFPNEQQGWAAYLWDSGLVVRGGTDSFSDSGIFVAKLSGAAVEWTTFLGLGEARGLVVDAAGNIYVSGVADAGASLPTTASFGPLANVTRAFVAKLSPKVPEGGATNGNEAWIDGVGLTYAVTVGGTQSSEAHALAVDGGGNAYVVGRTESADFPTTAGAFQTATGGLSDAFAFVVNAGGTGLIYSTLLGGAGNDLARGVAVDGNRNAHVVGVTRSANFPVTSGAWDQTADGGSDGFVTRLNASGSAVAYSTYLGGALDDEIAAAALDTAGNVFVSGITSSADFPTTSNALQPAMNAAPDGIIAALDPAGSVLEYSTFIGGSNADALSTIALNPFDEVYVFGTSRSLDFPTTATAISKTLAGGVNNDAIVVRLDRSKTLRFATYLGGDGNESAGSLTLDARGDAYVVGQVDASATFPTLTGIQPPAGVNGYVAKIIPRESLSFRKPATASSVESAGSPAANAVDGNLATAWSSESSDPQWVAVDLGSARLVERVWWRWGSNYARDSEVQVSTDGAQWTIAGVLSSDGATGRDATFAPMLVRYVRILGLTRGSTGSGYSVLEMDVFGPLESAPGTVPNLPPTVRITSPSDGATFIRTVNSVSGNVAVDAADSDGTIEVVEFFVNGISRGYKTEGPYTTMWTAYAAGTYTLTARAFDNGGVGTLSAPVTLTVLDGTPNAPPTVFLTSPPNGAAFAAPATIAVTAAATDSDDGVVSVQFWANGRLLIGTDTTAPYTAEWRTSTPGYYGLTAIAFDTMQGSLSQQVFITVTPPNASPAVSITSPPNGAMFTAPAAIALAADASDSDGGVARVEFFANTALVATDMTAPYTAAWAANIPGSFALTARAIDTAGAATISSPVTITVNPPPIALTSPLDGASFVVGTTIALSATAGGSDVARVDFLVNRSRIASDSTAPYSGAWSTKTVGTYTLSAQSIDGAGRTTASAPVTVTVRKRGRT